MSCEVLSKTRRGQRLSPGRIAGLAMALAWVLPGGGTLIGAPQEPTRGGTEISTPILLEVDPEPIPSLSDGNGVFEPGERVVVAPAWQNGDTAPQFLTGDAAEFTGPAGPTYTLIDTFADYGVLDPGAVASCRDNEDCYEMDIGPEGVARPATHWDTTFDETLSDGTTQRWALHVGDSFLDVPRTNLFYLAIETLLHHGVSKEPALAQGDLRLLGCTESEFCPSLPTTRAQAAVFVLMGLEDGDFTPEPCSAEQQRFVDVPAGSPFCPWIEELARRDITAGCGGDAFCPADSMTRAQMAVFLLKALHGPDFTPEPCTGAFTDVTCPSPFADWIEELFAAGITVGCRADPLAYCPAAPVTRGQKAAFVTRTFGLTLYGPNAQNSPPVVEPATFPLAENSVDGTPVGTVTVTDPDAGQSHTFAITAGNTDGAFAIGASTGEITVANGAALDFEGMPTFSLTVEATDDGTPPLSGSGTVTVELTDVNEPPTAIDDTAATDEDTAIVIDVLANDLDPDAGETLTIVAIGGSPTGGVTNNGSDVTYDPTAAFNALPEGGSAGDSFTYTIEDSGGLQSMATVTLTVSGLNDAPIAGDDAYSGIGNTQLAVEKDGPFDAPTFESTLDDVLENDADPDTGDAVGVVPFSDTLPSGAELDLAADGSFFYTPPPGQSTPDSFIYTIEDSFGGTDTGQVTIDIAKRVWYVDNTANGGTPGTGSGTATDPFSTLSDGGGNSDPDDAEDASAAEDIFYVHRGDGTATNQAAGITLRAAQRLLGEGVDLVIDPDDGGPEPPATLFTGNPANRPQVTHSGAGSAVTVLANTANGDRVGLAIRGLQLSSSGGNAIDVTSANGADLDVRIADNVVTGSGSEGIDVNVGSTDATQTLALHDNTVTATGTGIDIVRTAGTLTITAFGNNTVTGATGGGGISVTGGGGVVFDAVPGGSFDTVAGGTLTIGTSGDPVGGGGLALINVSGDLSYSNIDVRAGGGPGLRIAGTGSYTGAAGTRFRHLGAGTGAVAAVGGAAVDLEAVTADVRLATVSSSNSAGSGVRLVGLADGTGTTAQFAAGAGSSIGSAAGTAFLVDGGNATVAYSGTISNASGRSVVVQNRAADTATFGGSVNDTGTGILISSNAAGSATSFQGDLILATGSNAAFTAVNGSTVTATDTDSTLTTTTGTPLTVTGTNIGAAGLRFASITSNGAVNGVLLNGNTGSTGRLIVGPAVGGACNSVATCAGGAIQNSTGAAISLTNTRNVSFTEMYILNGATHGIFGTTMADASGGAQPTFELRNSFLESPGDGDNESAIFFDSLGVANITGRMVVADTTIQNFEDVGVHVGNNSGTVVIELTNLTIHNNSDTNGEEGVDVEAQGTANITLDVSGGTFTDLEGGGFDVFVSGGSGSIDVDIDGTTITGTGGPDNFPTPPAMTFAAEGGSSTLTFDITNNSILDSSGDGIFIGHEGAIMGRVTGNDISGIALGDGLRIDTDTAASNTATILVDNNNFGNVAGNLGIGDDGIQVLHRDGTKVLNLTITNNQIKNTDSEGIRYFADDDVAGGGPGNAVRIANNQFGNNGSVDLSDSIVMISQDSGTDLCTHIAGNTTVEGITLQQSLSAVLQITQASTAALAAANGGTTVTPVGTIAFNGTCTNPPLPTN